MASSTATRTRATSWPTREPTDRVPRPRSRRAARCDQQRVDLLGLIYAIKEVDIPGIADGLLALGTPTPQFNEARYRDDIDRLARQYLIYGKADSLGDALGAFLSAPSSTTASGSTAS